MIIFLNTWPSIVSSWVPMQRESSKVVVSAHGERESGTQINPRWNRASSPGKNNAGDDISTLTFKGASRSTNWVISGNIKALFL